MFCLTTAHRSKGLDWEYTELCDDFEVLMDAEAALAADPFARLDDQELNLLYVAITRARSQVQLNKETASWIDALPKLRQARELARERAGVRTREAMRG